jgi:hypothetical protein
VVAADSRDLKPGHRASAIVPPVNGQRTTANGIRHSQTQTLLSINARLLVLFIAAISRLNLNLEYSIMKFLASVGLKRFLRETFLPGLLIAVGDYSCVRLILFEVPLSFHEDLGNIIKAVLAGWSMMILLKGFYYGIAALAKTGDKI